MCSENDINPEQAVVTWVESDGKENVYNEGYNCICISEVSLNDVEGRFTVASIMHQICENKVNFEKAHIGYRIYDNVRIVYIIEQETH